MLRATVAGTEDFVEAERWCKRKLDFLRRLRRMAKPLARSAHRGIENRRIGCTTSSSATP